ncbi:MAG: hypothetical protein IJM59_03165 [Proteobacteria bacterium]|nr:hypothetical protein [Pseudomonadota bacterium]
MKWFCSIVCTACVLVLMGGCSVSQTSAQNAEGAAVHEGSGASDKDVSSEEKAAQEPKADKPESDDSQPAAPASETASPSGEAKGEVVEQTSSESVSADAFLDEFVHCEVKIDEGGSLYTAQAAGPTLEEARDNAVDEACAIPCAEQMSEQIEKQAISEDETEKQLDSCTEKCAGSTIVLAAACYLKGQSIYTEGAWNENGDAAPTNGEESSEAPQEQ